MPDVVAVGALDASGRAWFSNFGPWVDTCAPGVDVVSTFLVGDDLIHEWASWTGTSFSGPKVAAAIAQEMVLNGGTAAEAWARLSEWQHFRYPDLGIVFNLA